MNLKIILPYFYLFEIMHIVFYNYLYVKKSEKFQKFRK